MVVDVAKFWWGSHQISARSNTTLRHLPHELTISYHTTSQTYGHTCYVRNMVRLSRHLGRHFRRGRVVIIRAEILKQNDICTSPVTSFPYNHLPSATSSSINLSSSRRCQCLSSPSLPPYIPASSPQNKPNSLLDIPLGAHLDWS